MNTISIEDIVTENNLPNININIYKCMARQVKNKELQCKNKMLQKRLRCKKKLRGKIELN